jgi:hypothetical protein
MVSIITSCLRVPAMRFRQLEYAMAPVAITDKLDTGRRHLLKVNSTQLALQQPYPPAREVPSRHWSGFTVRPRQYSLAGAAFLPDHPWTSSPSSSLACRIRSRFNSGLPRRHIEATLPSSDLSCQLVHASLHWYAFLVLLPRRGLPWRHPPRQAQETKPQANFAVHAHTISGLNQADLPRGTAPDI